MNGFVLDLPENHAERLQWLERQMMGTGFGSLLAELSILKRERDAKSLDSILAEQHDAVLSGGLECLNEQQFAQLWRRPWLLQELQGLVAFEGGKYWQEWHPENHELRRVADRAWDGFRRELSAAPIAASATPTTHVRRWPLLPLGLALGVLLTFVGQFAWQRGPGLLLEVARGPVRRDLLESVAAVAAWQAPRFANPGPDSQSALAEVQALCKLLIANEERNPDRDLLARCRKWSDELAKASQQLAANPNDAAALASARKIVDTLAVKIREAAAAAG